MSGNFQQVGYKGLIGLLIGKQLAIPPAEEHLLVSFNKPSQSNKEPDEDYQERLSQFKMIFPKYLGGPCYNALLPLSDCEVKDEYSR